MTRQKKSFDTPPTPRSVIVTLTGTLLLLNLFVISLIGLGIYESRRQHEERARITTQNLAKVLEKDIADQIGKIDLGLFALAQEYTRQRKQEHFDETALMDAVSAIRTRLPEIDPLSITNTAGDATASISSGNTFNLNIADREYFSRLKNQREDSLLISKPLIGRVTGHWNIMFARRLNDPDGSFGGAVYGGILLDRLQQQFATLDVGKEGMVALRDSEMDLIARVPLTQPLLPDTPQTTVSAQLSAAIAADPQSGTYVARSGTDHTERVVSYRRIAHYPLFILVGLSKKEYLSGWQADLIAGSVLALFFLAVSALAARLILRSWQRQLATLDQLSRGEERLRMLAENASDTICRLDPGGHYLYVSRSILPTTGYLETDLLGRAFLDFAHPDDQAALLSDKTMLLHRPETRTVAYRFRHKEGHYVWLEANIRPVLDDQGCVVEFVTVSRDISQRRKADAQIEFLAHHDPLTGLPNRELGKERMAGVVARASRNRTKAALLFLDLDHFKKVNDSLGHPIGDELLKLVAVRLRECLRETDILCRQGGDEFLILMGNLAEAETASLIADAILARLSHPFNVDGHDLYMSTSIGIAIYPDDGKDFDTLSRRADIAMYHAKEMGRNAYRFFAEQMNVDSSEYLRLRNGLRRALERHEFLLHYQPQFDLLSGKIIGVEALIRWSHPEFGIVPPSRFIPVAEESGLIVPIGAWVLNEACRQAAAWRKAGLPPLVMAVNLSAVQFKRGDLPQTVADALAAVALPADCLELELTESILISDTAKVLTMVDQLKELGVKLSIDDFGTGYSCLAYLKRFRVDRLKIDQSFVRHITTDPNDAAIVQAIVQLACSLGLRTVAEGVETEPALQSLISLGCNDAQGYYFAKPMSAPDIENFLLDVMVAPARQVQ